MNPTRTENNVDRSDSRKQVLSVSGLTSEIKKLLENKFPFIWIYGEISNLKIPSSGHLYFTLKDEEAQIAAVLFRGQARNLKFAPADGMEVVGFGRISVYEPRGSYQLIFEYLEPKGIGALRIAFEQLKERLAKEGLFDASHKRALPFLPKKINLITSPSGAVVHDFIRIVQRRFDTLWIEIVGVRVQGDGAENEIADALRQVNDRGDADIVVLARGGGSLEDLWAFNTETVARAVFASRIPVVAAIGHETDVTIADFVADLRAPTPSAAAEMIVPLKADLLRSCEAARQQMAYRFLRLLEVRRDRSEALARRLVNPVKRVADLRIRLDDLTGRLRRAMGVRCDALRRSTQRQLLRLQGQSPAIRLGLYNEKLKKLNDKLQIYINIIIDKRRLLVLRANGRLNALNPTAILARGYSITRSLPDRRIVRASGQTKVGAALQVQLARGSLRVAVTGIDAHSEEERHGEKNV